MRKLDIIIPTWNNPEFLNPCVDSIIRTGILADAARLIIVNNGKQDLSHLKANPAIAIIETGKNLGWEGGLKAGMVLSDAEFVVFQNDDTFIPPVCGDFYQKLLSCFDDPNVAAVGPSTTCAGSVASIYHHGNPVVPTEVPYLIFFTVAVRRSHYDAVGGVDDTLPGGDDLDLSIRFRKAGFDLVVDPRAFIIHHGFKSGTRLRGDHTTKGGWNSQEMVERTNMHLIRKHGFRDFMSIFQQLDYSGAKAA